MGHGTGEADGQAGGFCAVLDLVTPVGVDFAGEVDGPGHGANSFFCDVIKDKRCHKSTGLVEFFIQ